MMNIAGKAIYLACGHTDMRKSINGLSAMVAGSFAMEPCSPALFIFCNRARNRLKVLEWDHDGFWLHLKRLEGGHFKWPPAGADEKTMTLSQQELAHLLGSPGLEQKLRRKRLEGKTVI
jgi:transposase